MNADVAGYSALMAADEEGTLTRLKSRRDEIIEPAITAHGGGIVKLMGDGLLVEFPSVVEAVRAGVDIQRELAERNLDIPHDKQTVFRIGINQGDVIIDGHDIYGDDVNIAARLQERGGPGGEPFLTRQEFVDFALIHIRRIAMDDGHGGGDQTLQQPRCGGGGGGQFFRPGGMQGGLDIFNIFDDHFVHALHGLVERLAKFQRRVFVSLNGQGAVGESAVDEMLRIAFWLPGLGVVKDIQHIRYNLKNYLYFIEMIRIISF